MAIVFGKFFCNLWKNQIFLERIDRHDLNFHFSHTPLFVFCTGFLPQGSARQIFRLPKNQSSERTIAEKTNERTKNGRKVGFYVYGRRVTICDKSQEHPWSYLHKQRQNNVRTSPKAPSFEARFSQHKSFFRNFWSHGPQNRCISSKISRGNWFWHLKLSSSSKIQEKLWKTDFRDQKKYNFFRIVFSTFWWSPSIVGG